LRNRRASDILHPSECEICQDSCDETLLLWCRRCDRSVCPRCTSTIEIDCCVECEADARAHRLWLRSLRRALVERIAQIDATTSQSQSSGRRSRSRSPTRSGTDQQGGQRRLIVHAPTTMMDVGIKQHDTTGPSAISLPPRRAASDDCPRAHNNEDDGSKHDNDTTTTRRSLSRGSPALGLLTFGLTPHKCLHALPSHDSLYGVVGTKRILERGRWVSERSVSHYKQHGHYEFQCSKMTPELEKLADDATLCLPAKLYAAIRVFAPV
jgi:hypothetical protein